jgi:hypothetical protein
MKEAIKQFAIFFLLFGLCLLLKYALDVVHGLDFNYFMNGIVYNVLVLGVIDYILVFLFVVYFICSMILPRLIERAQTNRTKQQ